MAPPIKDYSADPIANRMADMYKAGMTLAAIGRVFDVNAQRVHYLIGKLGVGRADGGVSKTSAKRKSDSVKRIDDRRMRVYGCTHGTLESLLGGDLLVTQNKACKYYLEQKKHAGERGIEFLITFPEWWSVWQESGYWNERGRGRYVMARNGDVGPYSVGNVFICTASQNSKDSFIKTPASERQKKRLITMQNRTKQAPEVSAI